MVTVCRGKGEFGARWGGGAGRRVQARRGQPREGPRGQGVGDGAPKQPAQMCGPVQDPGSAAVGDPAAGGTGAVCLELEELF